MDSGGSFVFGFVVLKYPAIGRFSTPKAFFFTFLLEADAKEDYLIG